jgi:L-asparaginase II
VIEVRRGALVESRHRVAFALALPGGRLIAAGGEPAAAVVPRSAVKPLQALALVESGAAERFGLSDAELALACASHSGEPAHVETVARWLQRLGLDQGALACGSHAPVDQAAARRLVDSGERPSPLHNNCSGKHAGMLTLALHLGVPPAGYLEAGHPVQRMIGATLAAMAGLEALPEPAVDGCGVPTWPLPLAALAAAMARLAEPAALPEARAQACRRIVAAMRAHPHLVAGSGRACTEIMRALQDIVVKAGAEGVYAAAWPARGLGLALKIEDGAARAAPVALLALLDAAGALDAPARTSLEALARPLLRNHGGRVVGEIRPAAGWPPAGGADG